jgi:hypothetical protein
MEKIEKYKTEDTNQDDIDIIDEILDVKSRISFLSVAFTRILEDAGHCNERVCGLQSIMFSLEDDLNKTISSLNKKFNLPDKENERRQP